MDHPREALVPVVSFYGTGGEDSFLQEEGLLPGQVVLKEVSLFGFLLPADAVLLKDGIKLLLYLGRNVVVQVFVSVGNVFPKVDFPWVDSPGEELVPIVDHCTSLTVSLYSWEEKHVSDVGEEDYSTALAGGSSLFDPDLVCPLSADNGFRGLALQEGGIRDVSAKSLSQELLYQGDMAVIRLSGVPGVRESFGLALTSGPGAGKCPLMALVDNFIFFQV